MSKLALPVIQVVDLFPELRNLLLELLAELSPEDWQHPTACPLWSVKDIVAHLLGGDVGILSRKRDRYTPVSTQYNTLAELINNLNSQWVGATARMSPRVLCELLAFTGSPVEAYFKSLDLFATGEPVSWAGPEPAPVWFDIASEFTERWHHQQQIRDATGRPAVYTPHLFAPVLDTFIRALPYSFRDTPAAEGTVVIIEITGDAGGSWFLEKGKNAWGLSKNADVPPATEITIPQDVAWRFFTKGVTPEAARQLATIRGQAALAERVFHTVAVIA
jgi:uncharacterized protein (TIGR03083 family)